MKNNKYNYSWMLWQTAVFTSCSLTLQCLRSDNTGSEEAEASAPANFLMSPPRLCSSQWVWSILAWFRIFFCIKPQHLLQGCCSGSSTWTYGSVCSGCFLLLSASYLTFCQGLHPMWSNNLIIPRKSKETLNLGPPISSEICKVSVSCVFSTHCVLSGYTVADV